MTALTIPELSLVVLVGVTGSGKSTFARAHFKPTEVISSDFCRGLVADDENDQSATPGRVRACCTTSRPSGWPPGRLTVDRRDERAARRPPRPGRAGREHDVLPVAIVLDVPEKLCAERNATRPDRDFGPHVIRRQRDQLRRGLHGPQREGFRTCTSCAAPRRSTRPPITRTRLFNDLRHQTGPFDVIGDVHGCRAELEQLLTELGYAIERDSAGRPAGARHPAGRRAVFLGDLVDRGPDTPGVLRLVMGMVGGRHRTVRAGQPRGQAAARAARHERQPQPRPGRVAGAAGRRARRVPRRGRAVHRRPDQPLRAGRRPPGRGPRRPDRALPRPRVRPGPRVLPVRADHRRDRRVRPAGPLPVGAGVPRPGHRAVRPHPGARARVAEQHPVPGHRLRLRRPADRAELSRTEPWYPSPPPAVYHPAGASRSRRLAAPLRLRGPAARLAASPTCWTSRTCPGRASSRPPTCPGSGSARRTPRPRSR